ncbi:hypothetical protein Syn7502_02283 [Synechococcus sp. PCC 7502]|uniref:hypothetical protein n=1 Tax=Synechococcus sp. PCC 7502 TaxID=1173263 RepID=UPI00029F9A96|nr:hypothetical protein [Synechococcus sp. PCC 7502]AFY74288.1 hypothetical protein Syn7502_02283 [Synechococcus sp. PCC 7502]
MDKEQKFKEFSERKRPQITYGDVKGTGKIEAVSISGVLGTGDGSISPFSKELSKPLSNHEIEMMLSNQAIVLNAIGNRHLQMSIDLAELTSGSQGREQCEIYLKNSFKAFELSRKCLTALNEVRNPKRSTFIKQQNNQLNLGDKDGQKVDRLPESKAIPVNSTVETVDKIYRG